MIFYYYRSLRGWAPCVSSRDSLVSGSGTSKLNETHSKPITLTDEEANLPLVVLEKKYPPPPEPTV